MLRFNEYNEFKKTNIRVYSGEEFSNIYNKKISHINKFDFFCNRFDFTNIEDVYFFTISIDEKIIGLAHIRKSPYEKRTYWLSYLSILEDYQNKKYASKLSDYIFKWFAENNLQFETSSYTKKGIRLKPLFKKLSIKYNVDFIDKETLI